MSTTPDQRETPGAGAHGGSQNKHGFNGSESSGTPSAVKWTGAFQVFGASRSRMGTVSQQSPISFEEFVETLSIQRISTTRDDYHKLTEKERKQSKRVDYVCAAVFAESPSPRKTEKALRFHLVFIDVDDNDDARRMIDEPQRLIDGLGDWSFYAY